MLRPVANTLNPASARPFATPRPTPLLAPVTNAICMWLVFQTACRQSTSCGGTDDRDSKTGIFQYGAAMSANILNSRTMRLGQPLHKHAALIGRGFPQQDCLRQMLAGRSLQCRR